MLQEWLQWLQDAKAQLALLQDTPWILVTMGGDVRGSFLFQVSMQWSDPPGPRDLSADVTVVDTSSNAAIYP